MNIPEKVKIGCKDYTVEILDKLLYLEGKTAYGIINTNSSKIEISTAGEVSKDSINLTFFHEVLHGLEDFLDIELTEEQIEKFAKGLYLFIKENPEIFKEKPFEITDNKLSIFDRPAGTKKDLKPRMGMDTIRAKITQFLSDGVIEDGRDSYQERADTLLSFELEPKITLKDIIGFYYHNVTEENT